MMRRLALIALLTLCTASGAGISQARYPDPWDPVVQTAAERAAARLGPAPGLEIRARILTIPELVRPPRE
jgi:hypothetical protein